MFQLELHAYNIVLYLLFKMLNVMAIGCYDSNTGWTTEVMLKNKEFIHFHLMEKLVRHFK